MKEIYVYKYSTDPWHSRLVDRIFGMYYMAMIDTPYPSGTIFCYGYTAGGAYRKALRKLAKQERKDRKPPLPHPVQVARWTSEGERVR